MVENIALKGTDKIDQNVVRGECDNVIITVTKVE